jgi:hypothetical protein
MMNDYEARMRLEKSVKVLSAQIEDCSKMVLQVRTDGHTFNWV